MSLSWPWSWERMGIRASIAPRCWSMRSSVWGTGEWTGSWPRWSPWVRPGSSVSIPTSLWTPPFSASVSPFSRSHGWPTSWYQSRPVSRSAPTPRSTPPSSTPASTASKTSLFRSTFSQPIFGFHFCPGLGSTSWSNSRSTSWIKPGPTAGSNSWLQWWPAFRASYSGPRYWSRPSSGPVIWSSTRPRARFCVRSFSG